MRHTKRDAYEGLKQLRGFIGSEQLHLLGDMMRGEEKEFFFDLVVRLGEIVHKMPKTYEQDGLGENAIAYLHYFKGGMDWYITEKDMEAEQLQAFGTANLGYGAELGYISIAELVENNVELEFYFTPKPLKELAS